MLLLFGCLSEILGRLELLFTHCHLATNVGLMHTDAVYAFWLA